MHLARKIFQASPSSRFRACPSVSPSPFVVRARIAGISRPERQNSPFYPSSAPYGALSQRRICATHFGLHARAMLAHWASRLQDACGKASALRYHPAPRDSCALRPVCGLALLRAYGVYALCKLKNDKIDKKIHRNIYVICNITHYKIFSSPLKYLFTKHPISGIGYAKIKAERSPKMAKTGRAASKTPRQAEPLARAQRASPMSASAKAAAERTH